MKKFVQLLKTPGTKSPADQQNYARNHFSEVVGQSNFRLWCPGGEISDGGGRLLLGVATYSSSDMKLLDALDETLGAVTGDKMDVFNVLDCKSQADFDKRVPGIGKVFHSPVVGFWEGGIVREGLSGKAATDFAIDRYSLLLNSERLSAVPAADH